MTDGWNTSAQAWITSQGEDGDFSRQHVLDAPMLARVVAAAPTDVLDLGCGEGRFCRKLARLAGTVTGIDPTQALITHARALGGARYETAFAKALPFADHSFDMTVAYLSLIDIPDIPAALTETHRVLRPGGRLLIANLNPWTTSSQAHGYPEKNADGSTTLIMDHYLDCFASWAEWDDIRIQNWHRPLSFYMTELLAAGFQLTHFDEPKATGGGRAETYNRAPYLHLMEWQKPDQ
ncbi:class I SAM-dependent methyltransferase [Shimia haliotis]|uniref:Methyltransferase domain-containing protein n=1 Tax=Shimia haliotis TaxID=1280847 RepID=A0A1I4GYG6_9RHOB|nr:class I SAM-dependent methyltransferase [Shimia haliotis]SFL35088.1 Methyltransferase domain-containing protein [Shimia haliotis]